MHFLSFKKKQSSRAWQNQLIVNYLNYMIESSFLRQKVA